LTSQTLLSQGIKPITPRGAWECEERLLFVSSTFITIRN
jgi:hypothetical protein